MARLLQHQVVRHQEGTEVVTVQVLKCSEGLGRAEAGDEGQRSWETAEGARELVEAICISAGSDLGTSVQISRYSWKLCIGHLSLVLGPNAAV